VEHRDVVFDGKASAFQELLNTSRTVLTLSSVILVALVGFIGSSRSPSDKLVDAPMIAIVCRAVTILMSIAVLLRGINSIYDDQASIDSRFYRYSYVVILITFLVGFFFSGWFVIKYPL